MEESVVEKRTAKKERISHENVRSPGISSQSESREF